MRNDIHSLSRPLLHRKASAINAQTSVLLLAGGDAEAQMPYAIYISNSKATRSFALSDDGAVPVEAIVRAFHRLPVHDVFLDGEHLLPDDKGYANVSPELLAKASERATPANITTSKFGMLWEWRGIASGVCGFGLGLYGFTLPLETLTSRKFEH